MSASRDYFRHEAALPADDGKMFVGELTQGQITRLWQINMVRRLDNPDGTFAGVIAASYDTNSFTRFYREVDLGSARTDRRRERARRRRLDAGWRRAQSPTVVSIADTPMFAAMRAGGRGQLEGCVGLDDVERMYAFATVPERGLKVVVGVDRDEAMRGAAAGRQNALMFASGITLLIALLALLLLRAQDAARRRHEALARERAILEATLTGMSDGIMMVDADLRLMAWNQHFPEFTGVPPEILRVGLPMEDILRGQVAAASSVPSMLRTRSRGGCRCCAPAPAWARSSARARAGGSSRSDAIRCRAAASSRCTPTSPRVAQAEERLRQAQTMAAVGRLTAGVAHDFNNLLIVDQRQCRDAAQPAAATHPAHARRLAVILQAAGRGADLVRQLLAFSRRQALAPVQVDLNKVVRGMGDLLRATLGRAIRVETKLDDGLWPALVDPMQIEQVILNLAINARDAMPDGGTLTIATANTSLGPRDRAADLPPGDYVVVAVSDTGTGMTEEVLRNAFEPFFTTKPPGQGSGLGLSQVYGVASQSGGGVRSTARSARAPRSACCSRARPDDADADDGDADRSPVAAPTAMPAGNGTARILVVDDEAECRETIAAMLSANGFAVVVAESGGEAMRLIESGLMFDLLLVDFAMPGMNGVELAQAGARAAAVVAGGVLHRRRWRMDQRRAMGADEAVPHAHPDRDIACGTGPDAGTATRTRHSPSQTV